MKLKSVVIDANIIVRSVLGVKVSKIMLDYEQNSHFVTPDICLEDAKKYLPQLAVKRSISIEVIEQGLNDIEQVLEVIPIDFYALHESEARLRIKSRDENDWPIVATALLFNCPIWTEDQDFFGSGIATWTSNTIHLYLQ